MWLVLLAVGLVLSCGTVAAQRPGSGPAWKPLNPGSATVYTGQQLLAALSSSVGDITLAADIRLLPSDWQPYTLPLAISAFNRTVLIRGDGRQRVLDWGLAIGLLSIEANTTLALDNLSSEHPGSRLRGVEMLPLEIKGSPLWPTVTGEIGHSVVIQGSPVQFDISNCNPDFVQVEVNRIQSQLEKFAGPSASQLVTYTGGVGIQFTYVPFPAAVFDIVSKQQVGTAQYTYTNMTSTCYDSSNSGSSGGGVPAWVGAVVGAVVGCALLALLGAALLWRRKRHYQRQLAVADEERLSKCGSHAELASFGSGKLTSVDTNTRLSGQPSGELPQPFLRTRFGSIDGVQLGELLGRGAFGRVYRGRWKGAVVAVKVIDHRVGPGKTHDLSREPLLSMSVSHPNVVITHKMCVVKVMHAIPSETGEGEEAQAAATVLTSSSLGASGSGGQRLPALDGSGMVELLSPHDVLQPGLYETWLITELCDRGSLAELIHSGRALGGGDPVQRDVWALLSLLDVAQGLEYLHSNTIIHGDLKPANVLLKAARNDRRGYVCKLGDFGLSRMLGTGESHVDTQSYGTASYAAPELLSEGKLTQAADIFSMGVIIWEILSASELYPGWSAMQVIIQVSQHGSRPELAALPPGCPPALVDLMQRCWAQDPTQRPKAAAVVEDLRLQAIAAMAVGRPQPQAAAGAAAAQAPPPAPTGANAATASA